MSVPRRRCRAGWALLVVLGLMGCANVAPVAEKTVEWAELERTVLEMESALGAADARAAGAALGVQRRLPDLKAALDEVLTWQEIACYHRFLTNACVAKVARSRRRIDARVTNLEAAAAQALRHDAAISRARAEAQRLEDRRLSDEAEAPARAERRRVYELKRESSEAAEAQRARQSQTPSTPRVGSPPSPKSPASTIDEGPS
jgi:hypothetical protein